MKIQTGLLEREVAKRQYPAHLGLQVRDRFFVIHAQDLAGQNPVPVVHQPHVILVVLADFMQAVGEFLAAGEQLLEAAETTGHGLAPRVDDAGIRQDQVNQADVPEIVGHLVDKPGRVTAMNARVIEISLTELRGLLRAHLCKHGRVTRLIIDFAPPGQAKCQGGDIGQFKGAIDLRV